MSDLIRKIIRIDMDAFYASVEQRDNPELKRKTCCRRWFQVQRSCSCGKLRNPKI